jgi:hypothetical protein
VAGANEGQAIGVFTLTATGGPVMGYTITIPAGADGLLSASPASGVLGDGQSVPVTLTLARLVSLNQKITISPGGISVTVTYSPPRDSGVDAARLARVPMRVGQSARGWDEA